MLAGYHGKNNLRKTGEHTRDALINLATVAAEDKDTIMTQSKNIAALTTTIDNLTQQLQQAMVRINTTKIIR